MGQTQIRSVEEDHVTTKLVCACVCVGGGGRQEAQSQLPILKKSTGMNKPYIPQRHRQLTKCRSTINRGRASHTKCIQPDLS